ncbi:MAG TPA: GMC oxidoreductase [Candidatus Saccharimonadales bacterium]|nr:GMC oxidoreductase [Candidatus Saccharimonadales bacterium]
MKTPIHDYLVVGSGCSAAMAAQTLVEAGAAVTMVDVGNTNPDYHSLVPQKDFITIRQQEADQYRYMIGDQAEGVVWGDIGKGAQIAPPRKHMLKDIERYLPIESRTFFPVESLGYGGLGIGWGLQCWEYSDAGVAAAGLDTKRMAAAYETVSKRIGISATKDDASKYTMVHLKNYQPSPQMDRNHQAIMQRYQAHKPYFDQRSFTLGRTPLALLTKDKGDRKAYKYNDMDFYHDNDQSAWRPWMTVNKLREQSNFTYIGGHLVVKYAEKRDHIAVTCLTVPGHRQVVLRCRKLILGSGALGSARLALRSSDQPHTQLPLLCNPYTYIPCLQPSMVGKAVEAKKLGFAQLSLFLDEAGNDLDGSVASLYGYQSLMLFRLVGQVPFLNFSDARKMLQYLASGLVIMGVHHPDEATAQKYVSLVSKAGTPTGDHLQAHYELGPDERSAYAAREKKFITAARKLGLYAAKRVDPGYGASIHYAGTLPFSTEEKPFTLDPTGRMHGTKNIYVADSSGFTYLPARGLTFSLLANAHITAQKVLENA